jgi:hypothetical protein
MRKYLSSLVLVLVVLGGARLALAVGLPTLIADVPYEFQVGGQKLPAGLYEFQQDDTKVNMMIIRNTQTSKNVFTAFTTRLAAREGDQFTLVFDQVGDQHYLSEIHVANEDGYYFKAATGKHTHATVKARKKA